MSDNDALLLAVRRIEENGWIQNRLTGPKGELCMFWALCSLASASYWPIGTLESARAMHGAALALPKLEHYLVRTYGEGTSAVTFNDAPGRTKDEVIAAFRAAAAEPS